MNSKLSKDLDVAINSIFNNLLNTQEFDGNSLMDASFQWILDRFISRITDRDIQSR